MLRFMMRTWSSILRTQHRVKDWNSTLKSKHTRNKVIIELSPAEFEMTRALVSAGAGDDDYIERCGTKTERSMCEKVTDWWRFRNHDQQLHGN